MGLGDEIMVTGEARRAQERDPRPVAVRGRDGRQRWHRLWAGNPRLATPQQVAAGLHVQWIVNGPGCRPYVDYETMRREFESVFPGRPFTTKVRDPRLPWRFTDWRAEPGELPGIDKIEPRGYLVVEPHVKAGASPNKQWGRERWQALVASLRLPGHPWVQLGPPGTRRLEGVGHVVTETFEAACTALSGAAAAVLPDGGLHHAAAALGVPAVVIFGGCASPANLGYGRHVNLFDPAGEASPCGQRVPCRHCAEAMNAIRPDIVAYHVEQILRHERTPESQAGRWRLAS
ncbi:MAG: glycosyltransferase family 9 protein [Kiloniellaceae bacterium]